MKKRRKIVSVAVVLSLIVAMETGLAGKPAKAAADYGISNPVTDSNGVTTWDKVKFGSYYQTAEFKPEPIKWRVLSVNGDDAFLLADQCLDGSQYTATDETAEEYTIATWETCSLRKWLNEDFYNEAFSDSEKAAIRETVVNNQCGEVVGNDTTDRIYLLSVDEVCNADYGFEPDVGFTNTRRAINTDYAKCNNASDSWNTNSKEGGAEWWLRTNIDSYLSIYACFVYENGSVNSYGDYITDNKAVRPALHLNLSSSVYTDAGEIDSIGNVTNKDDGISAPTVDSQGVATWDCVYLGNWKKAEWKKEPIEWRVLSVNGDDAFLLADKCLNGKPYHTEYEHVTWEECSLRKWLNEDFYNEAFSSSEQSAIRETAVVNGDNPDGIEGGNDTTDRIYLLSADEVCNADYGFKTDDSFTNTRRAINTDYAKCNNAENSPNGLGSWRLRSPGTQCIAALVDDGGAVDFIGSSSWYSSTKNDPGRAVRPALHLNLSSSSWSKSGKVSSGEIEKPVPSESPIASESPKPVTISPIPTYSPADAGKLGTVSIKSAKNSKKSAVVLTWNKVNGASSYQIQYSLNKKFTNNRKTKTITGTSYTLKKLKKKKTYYFRIRAYKKIGSKNVYGAWSKVKKVKIKK